MSLLKGLAAFKAEKQRQADAAAEREKPRAAYFNWKHNKNKEDKDVVYVRFLQEFDTGVPGYREDRGLPVMSVEHQAPGPQGYLRRANCTLDTEGQCYACERHADDRKEMKAEGRTQPKGWGQKRNVYLWALVDYRDGNGPVPVVISRSFGSSFIDDLILEVEEDDENRITNKMWKIQRTGSGKSTAWKLRQAKDVDLYDDADVELASLEEAVLRAIPYDDQAAYYGAVYKDGDALDDADEAPAAKPAAKPRQETGELEW